RVAQIPALRRAVVHDAVISLGIFHEPGVGLGVEPLVAFLAEAVDLPLQQVAEHLDDSDLAPGKAFAERDRAISRRIFSPRIEAAVAPVREPRQRGILLLEEVD